MFIVIKKKVLIVFSLLFVIIIAASIFFAVSDISAWAAKKNRLLPIYSVATEEKTVALTFDAAWGADKTRNIVKILNDNKVRGTFFLVGFWIEKYSAEVKFLHDNGIEIGNHSNNHLHMSKLSENDIRQELVTVNTRILELTGNTPRFFRAPFGEYNNSLINVADSILMQVIQWDVDSLDWKGLSANEISNRVLERVKNGSIVLFHNNSDHIVEALPTIISALKERGYAMVGLSELVYEKNYSIDNTGRQYRINS